MGSSSIWRPASPRIIRSANYMAWRELRRSGVGDHRIRAHSRGRNKPGRHTSGIPWGVATRYPTEMSGEDLTLADYRNLAEFRRQIRRFLAFSEGVAKRHGIEPRQHQTLFTLKGLPEGVPPTIGEIASRLFIRHHSAVELVNRLAEAGFVLRTRAKHDKRQVWIRLTAKGSALLRKLSMVHRLELERSGPELAQALNAVIRKSR
jgi:DNA-binding MarR family transcriptional regulator